MDKVLQTFEGLIRRSIAPSVTFFLIFVTGELIAVKFSGRSPSQELTSWIYTLIGAFGKAEGLLSTVLLLVVLGVGYALSAIQQILFDNRLKKNFDPVWRLNASVKSEGKALVELREKVFCRLKWEPRFARFGLIKERTDYLLYEILGGIDPTDTRPFVDTAKAIGIVFSSAIAVTAWNLVARWSKLEWWWALVLIVIMIAFYWLGREATAAQYRARALRLYVNFLMMPAERLEHRLQRPDERAASGTKDKESGK